MEVAARAGFSFLTPIIESSYGMWGWINRTLLQILRFFHGAVGNWGAALGVGGPDGEYIGLAFIPLAGPWAQLATLQWAIHPRWAGAHF